MKISVDEESVFVLSDIKMRVLCDGIDADILDEDIKRRVRYIVEHKYEQCFKRLKDEWEPKLKAKGVESIPLDEDAFAEMVFAQPDYKDRKQRELDEKL